MSLNITDNAKLFAARELGQNAQDLTVRSVSGGYSLNRKSLVGVGDSWLFAKEVDATLLPGDATVELAWLKKEYELMKYLSNNGFDSSPVWCRLSDDGAVLLMPAYRVEDGWQWRYPDEAEDQRHYVDAVVASVKELESATFSQEAIERYTLQPFYRDELVYDEGFDLLLHNDAIRTQVIDKLHSYTTSLHAKSLRDLADLIKNDDKLRTIAHDAKQLVDQPNNCFGHCDVRSDNLTYNTRTGDVKLIDWNWASFAPSNFGATEFLTDAHRAGVDISPWLSHLNSQQLAAMVGYCARKCIKEPLQPGSTLRKMQAETGAVSYELYKMTLGYLQS